MMKRTMTKMATKRAMTKMTMMMTRKAVATRRMVKLRTT